MHIDLNQGTIRFYCDGNSYDNEDSFECSVQFHKESPKTVHMWNILGKMTEERYLQIGMHLRSKGVQFITGYFPTDFKPKGFAQLTPTDLDYIDISFLDKLEK